MISKARLVGFGMLFALFGSLAFALNMVYKENKQLIKTNSEQAKKISDFERDKEEDKITDQINQTTVVTVIREVEKLVVDQEKIDNEVDRRVREIEKKYASAPKSPESDRERSDAISAARIDGLWEQYCHGVPNEADCP